MPLWHSRITGHENDRQAQQARIDSVMMLHSDFEKKMRKAASLATLWPRPALSPQDRSPFPPRISSLNRVPPLGWEASPTRTGPNTDGQGKRPATSAAETLGMGLIDRAVGTQQGQSQGTAIPRPRTSHHLSTTSPHFSDQDSSYSHFGISNRSSSLYALETATLASSSSPAVQAPGYALMPAASSDPRNLHNHFASSPLIQHSDLSYERSPTMRKASPMPTPHPIASSYTSSSSPWQHTTNTLSSSSDSAPTAGKTSQVLAKLTSECDRLRREIKAERAAKEEAMQQFQALKSRVNWLEEKKSMLSMQLDTNENALTRKERRMDDLKASQQEEVARRKRAEEREAEMGRKLGETVSQAASDVSDANMARKAAENAYATLETEYTGLTRRIAFLRKEVDTLTSKINENSAVHKKQVLQLEVLVEQQRQAQEKSERQVMEMGELLKSYRDTEENTKKLEGELQGVVHEMRWVMRLQEARSGPVLRHDMPPAPNGVVPSSNGQTRHAQKLSHSSTQASASPQQRRKQAPAVTAI